MIVRAWSQGHGFDVVLDYPVLKIVVNKENLTIDSSYNELLELQNLLSEKLAEFKTTQAKNIQASKSGKEKEAKP